MALLLFTPTSPLAHEIPSRVAVRAFVRPDGRVVRILVRVPLEAMRDVEFPKRGAGYLDIGTADSALLDAAKLWVADAIDLRAAGVDLPTGTIVRARASLPSDRAFDRYEDALATLTGPPLANATQIPVPQAMLDVMLEYPVADASARLSIRPRFAKIGVRTSTVLRFVPADGAERAYVYEGDPGYMELEPQWWHAASRFVVMGAMHLVEGIDHLLFLLCLIIPVRRLRPLIGIVTAFTVAHSITLFASALGFAPDALWFPPLVEVLIAVSIVFMAIENIIGAKLERRWMVAFAFGLVHGFGFSYALREQLQFAGAHLLTALAAFNIGIELAQIVLVAAAVPVLSWCFSRVTTERVGSVIISVLVAHTAWHWMTERFETLKGYRVTVPAFDVALAIGALRLAMGLLIVGAAAWALSGLMARLSRARATSSTLLLACGVALSAVMFVPQSARAQGKVRSTMTGVYTADQAVKGKEVFQGTCSGCHTVASHSGALFATRWMGKSLADFYDYVSRLMPKSAPGTLSEDEYVWVTAYVLKLNGMPASSHELSAAPELLKTIRIDSTRLSAGGRSGGDHPQGARFR